MRTTSKFLVPGCLIDLNENLTLPETTNRWKIGGVLPFPFGANHPSRVYLCLDTPCMDGMGSIHLHRLEVKINGKSPRTQLTNTHERMLGKLDLFPNPKNSDPSLE